MKPRYMRGFIEVMRKDNHEKELINVSQIVTVFRDNILTRGILDNGFHTSSYIIPCEHTYAEIIDAIEQCQNEEGL